MSRIFMACSMVPRFPFSHFHLSHFHRYRGEKFVKRTLQLEHMRYTRRSKL